MAQSLEDLDLPERGHWHAFLLVVHEDTFERHESLGGFLNGLVDFSGRTSEKVIIEKFSYAPKCTLSQFGCDLIVPLLATAFKGLAVCRSFLQ
jgi:hypothetical protein